MPAIKTRDFNGSDECSFFIPASNPRPPHLNENENMVKIYFFETEKNKGLIVMHDGR